MKKHLLVGLIVIAAITLSGCSTQKSSASATPTTTMTTETASYKDGEYDVVGDYVSPGGPETIDVKVTLKDNVITDATVVSEATRPESIEWQTKFVSGYKEQVIGKNINEINLTKVSGSSLTPKGFNDAIEKIKSEAKV